MQWGVGGGGASSRIYILLNEIQTMFLQVVKRSSRVLPADLCTDHKSKTKDNGFEEGTKTWRSTAGLFLTIIFWKFANLWILYRFSDIVCIWFALSFKQFSVGGRATKNTKSQMDQTRHIWFKCPLPNSTNT